MSTLSSDTPARSQRGHRALWTVPRICGVNAVDLAAATILLVGLTVWCILDVVPRARIEPGRPEAHKTDLTVYTTAGAAFFDGRAPYTVTNPRGWSYLYPPLFALSISPLSSLEPRLQAAIWFWISIALAVGCAREILLLFKLLWPSYGPPLPAVFGWSAAAAVAFPALDCLQRGQVGIALVYALLLGGRFVCDPASGRGLSILGGAILAWPVAVKLLPALPVLMLMATIVAAQLVARREPIAHTRPQAALAGLIAGSAVFWLLAPAALLGWNQNLVHIKSWFHKVVATSDAGAEAAFYTHGTRNQSLDNSTLLLADTIRGTQKLDRSTPARRWAVDRQRARRHAGDGTAILIARGIKLALVVLLSIVCIAAARRGATRDIAVAFALGNVAILALSPVAWTHYFVHWIPAVPLVPAYLAQANRKKPAVLLAVAPCVLTIAHYLAMDQLGWLGILGLGTFAWLVTASFACLLAIGRPVAHARIPDGARADTGLSIGDASRGPHRVQEFAVQHFNR